MASRYEQMITKALPNRYTPFLSKIIYVGLEDCWEINNIEKCENEYSKYTVELY
jgi:hypothetical protein